MTSWCPSCGEPLPPESTRFCVACGQNVMDVQQATVTRAPVPHGPPPQPMPEPEPEPAPERPRRRAWMIALVCVVVLAGGGVGAFLLQGPHGVAASGHHRSIMVRPQPATQLSSPRTGTQPSSPSAGTQQAQLRQLTPEIQQSLSARSAVVTATQDVGGCTMTPGRGIRLMNQAISQRQAVIGQLGTLSMTAVPDGQQLVTDFRQLLQQSVRADEGFIGWMQDIQNAGCPVNTATDASYQAALQASGRANKAKNAFLGLWNPLASQSGQPTFTAAQI